MTDLTIEYGEYAITDARTYIEEHTSTDAETEMLDRLFVRWCDQRTLHGIGYLPGFLAWLVKLGFELTGFHGDGEPWSGHTTNSGGTLLNEDFGWTYLFIGHRGPFLVIEWDNGLCAHTTPFFYRDTSDDDVLDWSRGTIWCTSTAQHIFTTEDSTHWSANDTAGTPDSVRFRLHDLARHIDADGEKSTDPACPTCGDPIRAGATNY